MTAHPGLPQDGSRRTSEHSGGEKRMSGYRITVQGVMSERFCGGFCGLSRHIDDGRTILTGDPLAAPALPGLLATLGNLGLEVLEIDRSGGPAAHTTLED
jgi:hypothetical protein